MTRDRTMPTREPEARGGNAKEPPAVEATQLLAGGREVVILHRGERYRLRVTQHDRLILTK